MSWNKNQINTQNKAILITSKEARCLCVYSLHCSSKFKTFFYILPTSFSTTSLFYTIFQWLSCCLKTNKK